MPSALSNKWVRKGLGALLILASFPVPITGNDLGLSVAIGLVTVGLLLLFLG